jgi:hypothetical protein
MSLHADQIPHATPSNSRMARMENRMNHRNSSVLAGLVAISAFSSVHRAQADEVTLPDVPAAIQVPAGHSPYLVGHAAGTQNYFCMATDTGIVWQLYTPQATLFDGAGEQVTTHFFSPNPLAATEFLPTWQHSGDTSAAWVKADAPPYTGVDFVEPGAVAWLRLKVVASVAGPTGGEALTATTYIHRVNTTGGVAPATGCSKPRDLGKKAFVPYTADYYFYREAA